MRFSQPGAHPFLNMLPDAVRPPPGVGFPGVGYHGLVVSRRWMEEDGSTWILGLATIKMLRGPGVLPGK